MKKGVQARNSGRRAPTRSSELSKRQLQSRDWPSALILSGWNTRHTKSVLHREDLHHTHDLLCVALGPAAFSASSTISSMLSKEEQISGEPKGSKRKSRLAEARLPPRPWRRSAESRQEAHGSARGRLRHVLDESESTQDTKDNHEHSVHTRASEAVRKKLGLGYLTSRSG